MSKNFCTACNSEKEIIKTTRVGNKTEHLLSCGHKFIQILLQEKVKAQESLGIKQKRPGFGVVKEIFQGFKPSRDPKLSKGVDVQMIVDREKNEYHQIVKDKKTGNILHEEHEPLSEHRIEENNRNSKTNRRILPGSREKFDLKL